MARMRAVDAAVRVVEKEGIGRAFGVPGDAESQRANAPARHVDLACASRRRL
jgi:glyoxylate carboligase